MNNNMILTDINPPRTEPERQEYFRELVKDYISQKKQELGRDITYLVDTLGCQMNAKDSEMMTAILTEVGYKPASSEQIPDFVLYNTCTVRENANQKIYGHLGILKNQKSQNPYMKIALCGCMMQESDEVYNIETSYRYVDIVFGTFNIYKLAELIYQNIVSHKQIVDVWDEPEPPVAEIPGDRKYSFKSGVNIMYGCDNFCTYCVVPYVRGKERSRRSADIINEIKNLVSDGVSEVMLLGQNVNSYGKRFMDGAPKDGVTFAELLRQVNDIDGIRRIRFMTSHPKDLSDELITAMSECDKVCSHLHLPLQSGSSRILDKMHRFYDKEKYLSLVDRIRQKMPDITLTTDIIVGFPGETEDDFEETLDVVRRVRYAQAYTFIYSERTGTPAAKFSGKVAGDVIRDRFERLLSEIKTISEQICDEKIGRRYELLVEEANTRQDGMVTGRLSNNAVVHIAGDESLIGQYVDVVLRESRGFYYIGDRC